MQHINTRRGFTQINWVGQALPDKALDNHLAAFTLIELLVVVLIIGILAAVAVPQYKKAVLKSRFSTLYPIAQSLAQGQESYYLNQGEYAEDLAALDVSVPGNSSGKTTTLQDGTQVKLGVEENHIYVRADKGNNALMIYQNHSPNFAGETHCEAKQDDDLANWLCEKGLDGTFVGNKFGYAIYALDVTDPNSTLGRIYYDTIKPKLDGDICQAETPVRCQQGTYTNQAQCIGSTRDACYGSSFNNQSVCIATGPAACHMATYRNGSRLIGDSFTAGWTSSFYNSSCEGNADSACMTSTFRENSICYANKKKACKDSSYDSTSFCTGDHCPTGTPKGTWNDAKNTYELNGWNGECCNPAYMTSGTCPANATLCPAAE